MNENEERARAERHSWKKIEPLPEKTCTITLDRKYDNAEFQSLTLGLIPESMEDKWFIYFEDPYLFFHRSWTGHCIYRVQFALEGEIFSLTGILVNRDTEQYKQTDDLYDAAILNFLIENLMLGNQTHFPIPSNLDVSLPSGVFQHNISGTGLPEKEI